MARAKKGGQGASSGLFGIKKSSRTTEMHWGKNCFNSSFPTAVACYMMANGIPAVYNTLQTVDGELRVVPSEIFLNDVFNCGTLSFDELDFRFESKFEPYQKYSFDTIDGIDLVVKEANGTFLSPLEVKLTVLPDSATCKKNENEWGCEMVVRSATTSYCALGMFDSVSDNPAAVRGIFEDACAGIGSWNTDYEMGHKTAALSKCVNEFQLRHLNKQKPLIMQTVWKTQGQSPILAENAFDIVVWSDYAFSRLFVDNAFCEGDAMSRPMRASARLARCLWELSKSGKIRLTEIYRQMAFGNQTDKEFSINGQNWRNYISSDRITRPILSKDIIDDIIEPGYINKLHPERRFDQTLYFTVKKNTQ